VFLADVGPQIGLETGVLDDIADLIPDRHLGGCVRARERERNAGRLVVDNDVVDQSERDDVVADVRIFDLPRV